MAKAKQTTESAGMPPLVITPAKGLPIDGNFTQILGYLKLREKEVARMKLSEDSVEQAKLVKKEAAAYRKAAEERLKTAIALLFDGPKDLLKSKARGVFDAIDRIESAAAKVLDTVEERRVADLNQAFEAYRAEFQERYQLNDRSLGSVTFPKWYYNKTPSNNEKLAKDDLEQQFAKLRKAQNAKEADIKMIRRLCADDLRLDVESWVERLERESVSELAEKIAAEKRRLAAVSVPEEPDEEEESEEPEAAAAGESPRMAVPAGIVNFVPDFPGRTKKRAIVIEYPCEMDDLLNELFQELRKYHITAKEAKEEAAA